MLARPELTQAQKDLLAAADYMDRHGHCQCSLTDDRGSVCFTGSLNAVFTGNPKQSIDLKEKSRFVKAYNLMSNYVEMRPVEFNDVSGRTKNEMVQAMREAAYSNLS